jgi:hypothetical protein
LPDFARTDFVTAMDHQDRTEPKQEGEEGPQNIKGRLRTLVEKASGLNESLDRVQESLKDASAETKQSE